MKPRCPDCDIELGDDEQMTCPVCGKPGMKTLAYALPPNPERGEKMLRDMRDLLTTLMEATQGIAEEYPDLAPKIRPYYGQFKEWAEEADQQLGEITKPD